MKLSHQKLKMMYPAKMGKIKNKVLTTQNLAMAEKVGFEPTSLKGHHDFE